ncbi:MAG: UvrD-helicase domain-containing protein [Porticoccaceae bacterium]|nr:UvrD-helicase domain-containing protein [Porticoccaceae bacterium]
MSAADQSIRDRALDITTSFAVSAPAGSGKTGLLIRRILRLLAQCEQPEQVLAITFTRKAAAEMQERIVQALALAQTDSPPPDDYQRAIWQDARRVVERDREQNWQLAASPSRLRIMTIDSLCRTLARQLAVETNLGDLPEPTDQPEFFYRDAIRQLFRHLDGNSAVGDALAILLNHLDNNLASLEALLENLLAKREQWLEPLMRSRNAREYLEQTLQNTVVETLAAASANMAVIGSELATVADYAAANLASGNQEKDNRITCLAGIGGLPDASPDNLTMQQWLAVAELLLTQENQWRKPKGITKRQGFPTKKESIDPDNADLRKQQLNEMIAWCEQQPGLLEQLVDIRNLPAAAYSDGQWQLLEALTLVLPVLVAELSVLFKSSHSCDFTEVTLAALSALGDDTEVSDLSLRLDYQIRHILVDEFQDTSSLQFRLLKKLTWGWQQGDGRTLFIVGDGMQSLYGFRNANVGIFLEARKMPVADIELEPLDLQVNFRSDSTVVDWVNSSFRHIFPAREDISRGAVSYAPAVAARSNLTKPAVTIDVFANGSPSRDEAQWVIERIASARNADPDGSIAILARARSHLRGIIAALQQQGIAWEATDIDPLSSRMAVIDLFSLTRALLNPADRIAWLAILRAPWCGLKLADLHAIANFAQVADANPRQLPWLPGQIFAPDVETVLSGDGRERFHRVAPVLKAAWQNRQRKPLRQWLEGTWLALGGPASLCDTHHLIWCQQYFDLLETHSRGSQLVDRERFEQAVNKLYARPAASHSNPVQLMTIHKSKGLEFDTVILPGLHRGGGSDDKSLLYWRERINNAGEAELLIAPPLTEEEASSERDENSGSNNQLVKHLKYEQKVKNTLEDARVLYVACTRAIKRLHLFYNTPNKAPTSGSLLAALWPTLADDRLKAETAGGAEIRHHEPPLAVNPEQPEVEASASISELMRLRSGWQQPDCLTLVEDNLVNQPVNAGLATAASADTANNSARHRGTVLHRTLSRIVAEGVATWDADRIRRQRHAWDLQLRQLGVDDRAEHIHVLEQAVTNTLGDASGRWLLSNKHQHSACELELATSTEDGFRHFAIDRTFVEDDIRWIIDYKSSSPQPGENLDAFLLREAGTYRQQLDTYRQLFAAQESRQIRTALYFPLIPHLHSMD